MNLRPQVAEQCATDARDTGGGSPVRSGSEQTLYGVAIPDFAIHHWQPESGERLAWDLPAVAGGVGLRQSGGLDVTAHGEFYHFKGKLG